MQRQDYPSSAGKFLSEDQGLLTVSDASRTRLGQYCLEDSRVWGSSGEITALASSRIAQGECVSANEAGMRKSKGPMISGESMS